MPNTYIFALAFLFSKREPFFVFIQVYVESFLAILNPRERTNQRVSELFNTGPNTSWRRSLEDGDKLKLSPYGFYFDVTRNTHVEMGVRRDGEGIAPGHVRMDVRRDEEGILPPATLKWMYNVTRRVFRPSHVEMSIRHDEEGRYSPSHVVGNSWHW